MHQAYKCCQKCGSTESLQIHHKVYRDQWEDALFADLIMLCRLCHVRTEILVVRAKQSSRIIEILQGDSRAG